MSVASTGNFEYLNRLSALYVSSGRVELKSRHQSEVEATHLVSDRPRRKGLSAQITAQHVSMAFRGERERGVRSRGEGAP